MGTNLTDEQRANLSFNSPEFDQDCSPMLQRVRHICLEYRKEFENKGAPLENVFDILPRSVIGLNQSPVTYALNMENYAQAIACINEGANDFNCVVHPEPTLSTSTPSLHIATLFGSSLNGLALNASWLEGSVEQYYRTNLNDLLYMYRQLKKGKGINLVLLAAYHATHPEANVPAIFNVMEENLLNPEEIRWRDLDSCVAKIAPPALKKDYTNGGRLTWVRDEEGR